MGYSNYAQASFHGGEWSKNFQGRIDHPKYKTGMNVCFNGFPVEEGAWVRRPGTRLGGLTYQGLPGKLLPLAMETSASYNLEFTDGQMRFWNGGLPVLTNEVNIVGTISTANPAILTLLQPTEWVAGDEIILLPTAGFTAANSYNTVRNRVLKVIPQAYTVPTWSSTTTYAQSAIVAFDSVNYISAINLNLNNPPSSSPADWTVITGTPSQTMALYDSVTGDPLDGSTVNFQAGITYALRLLRIATPYTSGTWADTRLVQFEDTSFLLSRSFQPQLLTVLPNNPLNSEFSSATITPAYFQDGPYLDAIPNSQVTVGSTDGNFEITFSFVEWDATRTYKVGDYVDKTDVSYRSIADVNFSQDPATATAYWVEVPLGTAVTGENVTVVGLQAKDVGRHVRFFSTPPVWTAASTFAFGATCFYNGIAYSNKNTAGATSTGDQPDTSPTIWTLNPTGFTWAWGKITSVAGPTVCNIQIITDPLNMTNPLMYTGVISLWRLGVYSDAVGWPSCGCLHEGRLWLGGLVVNRFDASCVVDYAGNLLTFSPTLPDGTVTDANGLSYRLLATDKNEIFWFSPEQQGIVAGTLGGEWLIQSSVLGEPLTPTSIQAKRVTKYGCANIEPRRTGIALIIVQKFARKCLEFLSDVFTGKFIAPNLNEKAKHLTTPGIAELAYQEELIPILWTRKTDGSLAGTTYKRQNSFTTEEPTYNGWHHHLLGTNRTVESLVVGPSVTGTLDNVSMVTNDPDAKTSGGLQQLVRWVEVLTDVFEEDTTLYDAWFVDGGIVPSSMYETTVASVTGLAFTGLWYMNGQTVAVFAGGLDVGNYLVTNGQVFVPYGTGVQPAYQDFTQPGAGQWMFTAAYVAEVTALNLVPRNGGILTAGQGPTFVLGTPIAVPVTTSIQSFFDATPLTGESGSNVLSSYAIPDFANGFLITQVNKSDFSGGLGLHSYNINTGAVVTRKLWSAVTSNAMLVSPIGCLDWNGHLKYISGTQNFGPVLTLNETTLAAISETGSVTNSQGTALSAGSVGNPFTTGNLGFINNNIANIGPYLIGVCPLPEVDLQDGQGKTLQQFTTPFVNMTVIQSDAAIGAHFLQYAASGFTSANYYGNFIIILNAVQAEYMGQVFNITSKKGKKKAQLNQSNIFSAGQAGSTAESLGLIGPIVPSQINGAWATFNTSGGIATDYTDNSTLAFFSTHDVLAPTWNTTTPYTAGTLVVSSTDAQIYEAVIANTGVDPKFNGNSATWKYSSIQNNYLCKIAPLTATIEWAVPINTTGPQTNSVSFNNCAGGLFIWVSPQSDIQAGTSYPVYLINTTNGEYKVVQVYGLGTIVSDQMCDSLSYSVMIKSFSYTSTATHAPHPLNSTVTYSATSLWYRLYVGADALSSPIPSSTSTFPTAAPIITQSSTGNQGQFPCVIGTPYVSQGQCLRPVSVEDTKGQTGPGWAKERRSHLVGVLLQNTIGIEFGTAFDGSTALDPAIFNVGNPETQDIPLNMQSGIFRYPLPDNDSFDSMLGWQIQRPYPATVVAIGGFLKTSDV